MNKQFNSQCGEDKWIVDNVILPEIGTYIEVGSAHPVINSNSKYFDDIGWRGLCIDADPYWAEEYLKHRSERCVFENSAVAFERGRRKFHSSPIHEISKLSETGEIEVEAYPLWQLQEKHDIYPNILFIDIEGHEYEAWRSANFHPLPIVIMFEYDTCGVISTDMKIAMDDMDEYDHALTTDFNHIYVLKGHLKK